MQEILEFWISQYKSGYFWLFMVFGIILGFIIGLFANKIISQKRLAFKKYFNLEKIIFWVSFIIAIGCLISSLLGETKFSTPILNFYVSFIFAWLLTKESSKNEFKKLQHRVAKNTYRHIEDVETTTLITKKRVEELCHQDNVSHGELQGIVDDLDSILTGIRSNKADWKDMLKKSYRTKIDNQDDPEGRLEKLKSPPNKSELKEVFKDDLKNNQNINENKNN